jgi:hypothetical protein
MQQTMVALPIDGHLFACCANRRIASMRQLSSWAEESARAASDEIIVDIAVAKIQLPFVEFTFVKRTRRWTVDTPHLRWAFAGLDDTAGARRRKHFTAPAAAC